ncbi:hypothetical protein HDU83_004194 [Entophlyctis luteolus]|nr:hypothetical protein HDU83_004194 [Entophlyctis luteolus]
MDHQTQMLNDSQRVGELALSSGDTFPKQLAPLQSQLTMIEAESGSRTSQVLYNGFLVRPTTKTTDAVVSRSMLRSDSAHGLQDPTNLEVAVLPRRKTLQGPVEKLRKSTVSAARGSVSSLQKHIKASQERLKVCPGSLNTIVSSVGGSRRHIIVTTVTGSNGDILPTVDGSLEDAIISGKVCESQDQQSGFSESSVEYGTEKSGIFKTMKRFFSGKKGTGI